MATNGAQQGFEPVLAAHNMMQSAGNRAQKEQAHQFLEQFQKSVCLFAWDESSAHWTNSSLQQEAWTTTLAILESPGADAAAKLFAATTLKGKVGCHVT
jgi:transportin-3